MHMTLRHWLLLLLALALTGCGTIAYVGHAAHGQFSLLAASRPIDELRADPATPAPTRARLEFTQSARDFASRALALPDNGSYRRVAMIDRPYVAWNVVAAPPLALAPRTWCFPVSGCVAYRGYFSPERARRFAKRLRKDGDDVFIGGVMAYSTLGWFDDPLPSPVLSRDDGDLAGLLFHELAHQVVYVKGDSTFNESFATLVEREGVRRWFARQPDGAARYARWMADEERSRAIRQLLLATRERLRAVYAGDGNDADKRAAKARLLEEARAEYRSRFADDHGRHAGWFGDRLNNALLAAIGLYDEHVPAFQQLLREENNDLPRFYAAARRLAALPRDARLTALLALRVRAGAAASR
jgi:predicted aminopeptidase